MNEYKCERERQRMNETELAIKLDVAYLLVAARKQTYLKKISLEREKEVEYDKGWYGFAHRFFSFDAEHHAKRQTFTQEDSTNLFRANTQKQRSWLFP